MVAGGRGHYSLIGTPAQIADELQRWFENGAADGFNILVPHLPGGLEDFAQGVVPELQRRGLFRTEYSGTTLRENLGLARPENRFKKDDASRFRRCYWPCWPSLKPHWRPPPRPCASATRKAPSPWCSPRNIACWKHASRTPK